MKTIRDFTFIFLLALSSFVNGQAPEIVVPIGHNFGSAVFSSDDQLILSSGFDQNINVWDAETGLLLKNIQHNTLIEEAFFSRDNKFIIAVTVTGVVAWETLTGKLLKKLNCGPIATTSLSNDNKYLLAFSKFKPILTLLDFQSGDPITKLGCGINTDQYHDYTAPVEINNNSTIAIGLSSATAVGIWNLKTGRCLHNLNHRTNVISIKFSADGLHVYTIDGGTTLNIWDAMSGQLLKDVKAFSTKVPLTKSITEATFSQNGTRFLTRHYDISTLNIWETTTGTHLATLPDSPSYAKINFSNDGKRLVIVTKEGSVKIINLKDGTLVKEITGSSKIVLAKFNHDKSKIGIAYGKNVLVIDMATGFLLNKFLGHSSDVISLAFSPNGELISSGSVDKSLKLWNLASGALKHTFYETFPVKQLSFDKGVTSIYSSTESEIKKRLLSRLDLTSNAASPESNIKKWNILTGTEVASDYNRIGEFSLVDQKGIIRRFVDTKIVFDTTGIKSKRTFKYTFNEHWPMFGGTFSSSSISKNGKLLALQFLADSLRIYDIQSGATLKSIQGTTENFKKNKYWTSFLEGEGYFGISPDSVHVFFGHFSTLNSAEFSDDNQKLVFVSFEPKSRIYDLVTDKTQVYDGAIQGVDWKKDLAIVLENNGLYVKDLNSKKNLLSWIPIGDSEYLVTHPSGLFDASPGAMEKLYFVQGLDRIDFSQLKARYYEPGLWKKVMNSEKLRNVVGMKSIELPPDIRVGQVDEKGYLPIELTNKGGGIGEVTVLINGKEAIADARPKGSGSKADKLSLKVYIGNNKALIKGADNFIAVKAWNEGHWVVSRAAGITYAIKGNEQAYKPAIHIVTCGVSDYMGTELDLKYAAKDADDVSKALQLGAKKLFGTEKSYIYNLTTSQPNNQYPTKSNILKTFDKVSSVAHPLDVVVVYLSGHGINHGGQDGDWFYLTQDAYTSSSTAYNDPEIRRTSAISSNELVELFKKIPALKQVLMIDACASGKVVENLMAKKDIESTTLRALDRMRDRTGLHIITGCTADAVSYEASKFGQGVLTYSLLEGIRGAALREDQFVDVNKLFQYSHDRVPTLAEGIGGIQTPQVFSPQGGQSFDIGQLTDLEKRDIPIAKIRPVYIRSTFIDDDQLEDALQIGKKIDEALNEAASKGANSSIIFVDVREYPEGCKLSGRYKQENGMIKLRLRKKCEGKDETIEFEGKSVEEIKTKVLNSL